MKRPEKACRPLGRAARPLRRKECVWFASLLALAVLAACSAWVGQEIRTESDNKLIRFTFAGEAGTVCLSGDFNDWSPDSSCLKKKGERWEIQILLPPGRYIYGFLLDGKDWVPDPGALLQEADGFGRNNSVLFVE
jgi:1,4-alpha-glucan branching enzyme